MNDALLVKLHDHLRGNRAASGAYTSLSAEERRLYHIEGRRASRAKQRATVKMGNLDPTAATVRGVLADAAIMMLATGEPGSDQRRSALAKAFAAKPGVILAMESAACTGKLWPKFVNVRRK